MLFLPLEHIFTCLAPSHLLGLSLGSPLQDALPDCPIVVPLPFYSPSTACPALKHMLLHMLVVPPPQELQNGMGVCLPWSHVSPAPSRAPGMEQVLHTYC